MTTGASNTPSSAPGSSVPGILVSEFIGRDRKTQTRGWSALWDAAQNNLWDRGKPSPALMDLIESGTDLIPQPNGQGGRRPRVLVPGCGKGYDVVMLALHGYDAYGLDVSPKGVETAREYAVSQLAAPSEYNWTNTTIQKKHSVTGRGQARFVTGDFFANDWQKDCCSEGEDFRGFDLIYDYTFLCALLPEMRQDWARRMSELLAPSGVLICLEFPLYKDLKLPGPPWGLREGIYWNLLAVGGNGVIDNEEDAQAATQATAGGAFTRLKYIKPAHSYEVANGTDMLSIWALKSQGNDR